MSIVYGLIVVAIVGFLLYAVSQKDMLRMLAKYDVKANAEIYTTGECLKLYPEYATDADKRLIGKGRVRVLVQYTSIMVVFEGSKDIVGLYDTERDEFFWLLENVLKSSKLNDLSSLADMQMFSLFGFVEGID